MNILWEDKKQAVFEWLFYLNVISIAITVKIKKPRKERQKQEVRKGSY